MKNLRRLAAVGFVATIVSACGGGGSDSGSTVPAANNSPVSLASDTHSTCVTAQNSPQTVTLPATGGVTAMLNFAAYDVGGTGCQNVTVTTGSSATALGSVAEEPVGSSATVGMNSVERSVKSAGAPILTLTMGEGFATSFGATTIVSGTSFHVDPSINFPDGTYNALVTFTILGTAPVTLSLQFTASGGVLTVANANVFPFHVPGGAVLSLYDRGVVPVGFTLPTATASPRATSTPLTTPTPTYSGDPGVYGSPPPPTIGTATYSLNLSCPGGFYPGGGPLCVMTQPLQANGVGNYVLPGLPGGGAGTISYTVDQFPALSYYIEGCAFPIQYSGGGLQGTFTLPDQTAYPSGGPGACYIHLLSAPAGFQGTESEALIQLYFGTSGNMGTELPTTPVTPSPSHS